MNATTVKQDYLEDIRRAAREHLTEDRTSGFAAVVLGLVANAIRERDRERKEHFERLTATRLALRDLVDAVGGECRLDHHGFCQAHFIERVCSVVEARKVLEEG